MGIISNVEMLMILSFFVSLAGVYNKLTNKIAVQGAEIIHLKEGQTTHEKSLTELSKTIIESLAKVNETVTAIKIQIAPYMKEHEKND